MDITVSADHGVKIKVSEKSDKYFDRVREQGKLWNMKVTVLPFITGAHGMVPKALERNFERLEIVGRAETTQIAALLRLARILVTWGDLLSLRLQWKNFNGLWYEELAKNNDNNNNYKESWGDLLSLSPPLKNHQLTLVWKNYKEGRKVTCQHRRQR